MKDEKETKTGGVSTRAALIAALVILVGLPISVWAAIFASDVRRTHGVLREHGVTQGGALTGSGEPFDPTPVAVGEGRPYSAFGWRIDRLGGPERAARRLRTYLRLPEWVAPHQSEAAALLEEVEKLPPPEDRD